ncbi:MAG: helix-turn-helix domain-containing protein [Treponema sp.]
MESYGELLKNARETKNLDYETVERETSIIRKFLEGLENEDNSAFPGEAYMLGFMRNYAEYLGVSPDAVLTLYKNKALQESPVPEALLAHERPKYLFPLIIGGASFALALCAVGIVLLTRRFKPQDAENVVLDKNSTAKKYEISDKVFTGRLYAGDKLIYAAKDGEIILTVSKTLSSLGIDAPVGTLLTELAEESELDVDGDGKTDFVVYVSDISNTDASRGAEVRVFQKSGTLAATDQSEIPLDTELDPKQRQTVIFDDNRAYPFTVNASFRGACEFRYRIDRKEPAESYYASGELVTMTANNGLRLWMSNSNAVKLSVVADSRNYDLEIGKAGQVLVEDIKWIRGKDGRFRLAVIELD